MRPKMAGRKRCDGMKKSRGLISGLPMSSLLSVHDRHGEIEDNEVGRVDFGFFDGIRTVSRFDEGNVSKLTREKHAECGAEQVIVHDQNTFRHGGEVGSSGGWYGAIPRNRDVCVRLPDERGARTTHTAPETQGIRPTLD